MSERPSSEEHELSAAAKVIRWVSDPDVIQRLYDEAAEAEARADRFWAQPVDKRPRARRS